MVHFIYYHIVNKYVRYKSTVRYCPPDDFLLFNPLYFFRKLLQYYGKELHAYIYGTLDMELIRRDVSICKWWSQMSSFRKNLIMDYIAVTIEEEGQRKMKKDVPILFTLAASQGSTVS